MYVNLKYGSYGYEFEMRKLEKDEYAEWDSFVEKSPQGTVFHKTSWLKSYGDFEFRIIACVHGENIVAGIPLTYTKRFGIKFALNPLFTPYLGVIFRESNQKYNIRLSFEKELSKVMAKIAKDVAPYVRYKFHYNFLDPLPFLYAGFSVRPRYNYVLDLNEDLNAILGNMEKDNRNRITRALKYGLELSEASPTEMAELICQSFERKNRTPPISKKAYERYLESFHETNTVKSIIVKDKDDLLAGGTIAYDSHSAYYLLGGFVPESKYKGTGPLAIWTLIRNAKEVLGLKEFDFLGVLNENIERFYRGFGGKLTQSYIIYKNNVTYHLATTMLKTARMLRSRVHTLF